MWPCISFSGEKCSSKFNDLKTVSISDTVPKKNVKSALGSMKANGFQWFPNTNATHVLKKTACDALFLQQKHASESMLTLLLRQSAAALALFKPLQIHLFFGLQHRAAFLLDKICGQCIPRSLSCTTSCFLLWLWLLPFLFLQAFASLGRARLQRWT